MSIRPHPTKGAGWWYIDLGKGKDRLRIKHEGTKESAHEVELSIRRKRGTAPRAADPRLREIAADYLSAYQIDHLPSGHAKQKERVEIILAHFGAHCISTITPELIEQYKRSRINGNVKPITVNKELSALSGMCKYALDMGMIDQMPRIKRFPPKMTKSPIPQVPTAITAHQIIEQIVPRLRELYRLSLMAGLRPGEARLLRKENWNSSLCILIVTGKGNKTRHIPIVNKEMQAELTRRALETKSGYLWESPWTNGPYVDIRRALSEAAKRAGWSGKITPHVLRHAAATDMIDKGVDVSIAQQLLGHSTIKVTETYLHIRQNMLIDAMHRRDV